MGPTPVSLIPGLSIATRAIDASVRTGGAPISITDQGVRIRDADSTAVRPVDTPAPMRPTVNTPRDIRPLIETISERDVRTAVDLIRPKQPDSNNPTLKKKEPAVEVDPGTRNGGNGKVMGCATCGTRTEIVDTPAPPTFGGGVEGGRSLTQGGVVAQRAGVLGGLPLGLLFALIVGGGFLALLFFGRDGGTRGNPSGGRKPKAVRCSKCGFFRSALPGSKCKGCARKRAA